MPDEMRTAKFIERPQDEFNNRTFTPGQPLVILAKVEPGQGKPGTIGSLARLHVIEPEDIRIKQPTMSAQFWQETDLPVGPINQEDWLKEISKTVDYTTA